jgi:hypothetical protein
VRKSPWLLLVCVLIGGMFGGLLGEILLTVAPGGIIQDVFAKAIHPGLNPPVTVDLRLLTFTIGFTIKMNLLTFIGMILGVFIYKQI